MSSRTATAGIGTDVTFFRVAVVMSAVHVKPGRASGTGSSRITTTLKFVACVPAEAAVAWIWLLQISLTCPFDDFLWCVSLERVRYLTLSVCDSDVVS